MPVFLEPNREFPVVLESDKDRTPTPTFYARSLSMRLQQEVAEALDLWFTDGVDTKALFTKTVEVFLKVFTRIENMQGELSADWLYNLTYSEARELLRTVLHNNHLDHHAKKD